MGNSANKSHSSLEKGKQLGKNSQIWQNLKCGLQDEWFGKRYREWFVGKGNSIRKSIEMTMSVAYVQQSMLPTCPMQNTGWDVEIKWD